MLTSPFLLQCLLFFSSKTERKSNDSSPGHFHKKISQSKVHSAFNLHICVFCKSSRTRPLKYSRDIQRISYLRENKAKTSDHSLRNKDNCISQRNFFSCSLVAIKSLGIKGRMINSCVGNQRKTI